jgi:hypothetical protein
MPAGDVAVLDQKDATGLVNDNRPHTDRQPACKTPIEMQNRTDEGLESAAHVIGLHAMSFRARAPSRAA